MAEENEILEILDDLSKNAMFRLSLCSKELFHSNFWAWLIEQNPEFLAIFGNEFVNAKNINLLREEKICTAEHKDIFQENKIYKKKCVADLAFTYNDKLYIVENKLKSLPNEEQLNDYLSNGIEQNYNEYKDKRFVILTSFTKPIFINENSNFKYVSYEVICQSLENLKHHLDDNQENKNILENYIKYLKLMNDLNKALSLKNSELTYGNLLEKIDNEEVKEKLEKIHFDTFIKKMMYCNLVNELTEELTKEPEIKNLFTCVTYSSKAHDPYMDIMFTFHNRSNKEISNYRNNSNEEFKVFLAGIQISGKEYRKYFNVVKKKKQKNDETKYKLTKYLYENFKIFIDKTDEPDEDKKRELNCNGKNNNGFYCYDYEDDAWLYRKTTVNIESKNFEDLKKQILDDLDKISKK